MEDLRTILSTHNKSVSASSENIRPINEEAKASTSEIPDIFFDEILLTYRLSRVEILLLMYFYRITWCKPNLYKKYGIAPMISLSDTASKLEITMDMLHQSIRKIETFGFIETIRSGQYFVRRYFTVDNDIKYGQNYDDFL